MKILQKLVKTIWDFVVILLLYFDQYRFVFLYCKDTNPVLKYPVFIKTSKIFEIKKKVSKISLKILLIFPAYFYQSELIFGLYFYTVRIQTQY